MNLLAELAEVSKINLYKKFCKTYKKNPDTELVIFGAGDQGMLAAALLKENDMMPAYFCDNDLDKQGMKIKNIPVISPQQLVDLNGSIMVVVNDTYRHEKKRQLLQMGISLDKIWMIDFFNPLFKNFTYDYIAQNHYNFEQVYECLYDAQSQVVFTSYLKGVSSSDLSWYEKIKSEPEYFPADIMSKKKNHIFLDVGAYDGNTIEEFISFVDNDYEKIYAFEPFEESVKKIQEKEFSNIEIFSAAASDQCGKKSFYCNDYGDLTMVTTILENGANHRVVSFNTITIDQALHGREATFIKMDIEGSELAALHGAEKTIKKYKPFLAICMYHKREDLITILPYIKAIMPEYRFFLRHHSNTPSDMVLYCTCE